MQRYVGNWQQQVLVSLKDEQNINIDPNCAPLRERWELGHSSHAVETQALKSLSEQESGFTLLPSNDLKAASQSLWSLTQDNSGVRSEFCCGTANFDRLMQLEPKIFFYIC